MAKTLDEFIGSLPSEEQHDIELRYLELLTLEQLRLATKRTQRQLADTLGVGQDTISRLEHRRDMLLSTMRDYVESMGGTLHVIAEFPDRPPVRITHLALAPSKRRKKKESNRQP
jgi:DNA-binding XRE family transcriptional regulator